MISFLLKEILIFRNVLFLSIYQCSAFVSLADVSSLHEASTDLKNRTGLSIYFWENEANGGHIGGTT